MPIVSVIIPTHNCARFITDAIESILSQTYKDYEVIVIDDGSTDDTRERLREYVQKELIRYIYKENKGVAEARNTGILAARGDYIAYVDADDKLDRRMIGACLDALTHEQTEWCITDILRIETRGADDQSSICKSIVPKNLRIGILKDDFSLRSPFFKKQTLLDIGLYDKELQTREDWDMNIRLILAGIRFSYLPEPLYIYRIREDSLTKGEGKKTYDSTLRLLRKHHKKIAEGGDKEISRIYAEHQWRIGRNYLTDAHNFGSFFSCFVESVKYEFSLRRLLHPFYFHLAKHFTRRSTLSK
jgi:glycosyltransferase involved in cell wall biosynthesis